MCFAFAYILQWSENTRYLYVYLKVIQLIYYFVPPVYVGNIIIHLPYIEKNVLNFGLAKLLVYLSAKLVFRFKWERKIIYKIIDLPCARCSTMSKKIILFLIK